MIQFSISRGWGHPWDRRPGFDLLEFTADAFVARARKKFWEPWLVGFKSNEAPPHHEEPSGVLYKPSGWQQPWEDRPAHRHGGSIA
jgi:hypothetical protein